jgi:hypothetical protein
LTSTPFSEASVPCDRPSPADVIPLIDAVKDELAGGAAETTTATAGVVFDACGSAVTRSVETFGAEECGAEYCGAEYCGAEDCGQEDCGADTIDVAPPTTKALVVATLVVVIVGVRLGIDAVDEDVQLDCIAPHLEVEGGHFDSEEADVGGAIEDTPESEAWVKLLVDAESCCVEEERCCVEEEEEEEAGISSAKRRKVEGSSELRLEPPETNEAPLEGPP